MLCFSARPPIPCFGHTLAENWAAVLHRVLWRLILGETRKDSHPLFHQKQCSRPILLVGIIARHNLLVFRAIDVHVLALVDTFGAQKCNIRTVTDAL